MYAGQLPLEKPACVRNLTDQESEREAGRQPDQRGQSEFEQRLQVNPTHGERQQDEDGNMDNGDCQLIDKYLRLCVIINQVID